MQQDNNQTAVATDQPAVMPTVTPASVPTDTATVTPAPVGTPPTMTEVLVTPVNTVTTTDLPVVETPAEVKPVVEETPVSATGTV